MSAGVVAAATDWNTSDLEKLAQRCTVRVAVGEQHGTGFFLAPRLVMTCRHVIEAALNDAGHADVGRISVEDHRGRTGNVTDVTVRPGVIPPDAPRWPDLALLDVNDLDDLPAVVIDAAPELPNVDLFLPGYPGSGAMSYETLPLASGGQANYRDQSGPYLRLTGDRVVGGFSGRPVVSRRTGLVCAMVRLTKDHQELAGGFAVPVATMLDHLPRLVALHDAPPAAARDWLDACNPKNFRDVRGPDGRRYDPYSAPGGRQEVVDLVLQLADDALKGVPMVAWQVKTCRRGALPAEASATSSLMTDTPVGDPITVQVSDLGAGMLEVLDGWSRRRLPEQEQDMLILGPLLLRALLPGAVEELVKKLVAEEAHPLVRLRVPDGPPDALHVTPWEFASSPQLRLASDRRLSFSRYVDRDSPEHRPRKSLRVLGTVVCPEDIVPSLPGRITSRGLERFSGSAELRELIEDDLRRVQPSGVIQPFFETDTNVTRLEQRATTQGPWDVVHYVGFGWEHNTSLAFGGGRSIQEVPVSTVVGKLAGRPPAVVVFQLLSPPLDRPSSPLSPARLQPLLSNGVQAVVVAHHVATRQHLSSFNTAFYDALARGDSVETAVQCARQELAEAPPEGDHGAFGAVTVTTIRRGDVRLIERAPPPPSKAGSPQGPKPEDLKQAATDSSGRPSDVFTEGA